MNRRWTAFLLHRTRPALLLITVFAASNTFDATAREKPRVASRVPSSSIAVPGLHHPVEILTDRWGVPHIYAKTLDDVFFAQGFQAARDRLWQMDLWRKRRLGEMAKDFGPAYVDGDRMARAVL